MLTLRELPHLHQLASMLPGHSSSSFFTPPLPKRNPCDLGALRVAGAVGKDLARFGLPDRPVAAAVRLVLG